MPRYPQMKTFTDQDALRDHLETLGIEIPIDDEVDPTGALAAPMTITDGALGRTVVANRFAALPMEGWDGLADGRPSDLVRRRWKRLGESGAGLVWCEATAVQHDGKANPNQLVLNETTVDDIAELRTLLDPTQVTVLQLTHSGRYARPIGDTPTPRILYEHPLLDDRAGGGRANVGRVDGDRVDGDRADGGRLDGGRADGDRAGGGRVDGGRADGGRAGGDRVDGGRVDAGRADAGRVDVDRANGGRTALLTDEEIDELIEQFIASAVLAEQAGFDFVDIKACHGYLGHEFLSAMDRPGRYGGTLQGRSNFLRTVIAKIREAAPDIGVAVRLSLFDFVPHTADDSGVGRPVDRPDSASYRHAFSGDGTGLGYDLTETHELLDQLAGLGVGLVCATAGSPYYVPHVQRPAYFPPSDGYQPPEDPLVGVARLIAATAEVAQRHREMRIVGAGLSYLQQWLPNVGQAIVAGGGADSVGLGRMMLSYPHLPADVLADRPLNTRLLCRTFSDCTTAPRNGLVSGCYPLDEFYKQREERVLLAAAKKQARTRLR